MTWRQMLEGLASLPAALREIRRVGNVKILTIGPNDALVIETEAPLSQQQREQLTVQARHLFPDVKIVILDSGFHMSVLHRKSVEGMTH